GRAMQEAMAVEGAFATQAQEPATRPSPPLRELADSLGAEAKRCGVALDPALQATQTALARLDSARALLYGDAPDLPDAAAVLRAWDSAASAMDGATAAAARAAGWPVSLRAGAGGKLRASAQPGRGRRHRRAVAGHRRAAPPHRARNRHPGGARCAAALGRSSLRTAAARSVGAVQGAG